MKVHIMHIPKTGGITLYRALQAAGVDVTRSHDPAEAVARMGSALVITLLRNPVDRIWSVYRYQYRGGHFSGTLLDFLYAEHDPWWWGVSNVQARYMRPGVLFGLTDRLDAMVQRVCMLSGKEYPEGYETHGVDDAPKYTAQEHALISQFVDADAFVGTVARGW